MVLGLYKLVADPDHLLYLFRDKLEEFLMVCLRFKLHLIQGKAKKCYSNVEASKQSYPLN